MAINPRVIKKKPAAKKAPSGTLTERMGEARNRPYKGTRGGAVTRTEKPRVTGRQYSGDSIKMGQGSKGSVTKPKVVPLGDRPNLLSGPQKEKRGMAIPKGAALPALTAGFFLDPSTFDYRRGGKAQAPAPAKGEKLMKGMPSVGFGGPTSSAAYGYSGRKMAGAQTKAKAKSTVWGEARPGAARAMGVSKVAPVDQRKIAEGNKKKSPVPPKPRLRPSVSQPQAQPMAKKRTRPLTRYQRDN